MHAITGKRFLTVIFIVSHAGCRMHYRIKCSLFRKFKIFAKYRAVFCMGISLFSHAKNSAYMLEKFEAISPDLIIFDMFYLYGWK